MFPCSECHRHIHETEQQCPFCGTAQRLTGNTRASSLGAFTLAAVAMFATGCGKDIVSVGTDSTGTGSDTTGAMTTTTDESGSSDSTDSTGTDTNASTSTTSATSGSFYAGPDYDLAPVSACDPFAQDCPDGEKCVPWGSSGGTWDANKCVPVLGDGQPGDPCTYGGVLEATDDCGPESACWNINDESMGTCTAFCQGTPDDPMCAMGTKCLIANQGSITLCVDLCDPLLQDCGDGLGCYWGIDDFYCLVAIPDIPEGEPCGYFNDCAPGLYCADVSTLANCAGSSCCTSYCALDDMLACPDPNLECVSFFANGMPPAGYENVGICIVPGP